MKFYRFNCAVSTIFLRVDFENDEAWGVVKTIGNQWSYRKFPHYKNYFSYLYELHNSTEQEFDKMYLEFSEHNELKKLTREIQSFNLELQKNRPTLLDAE